MWTEKSDTEPDYGSWKFTLNGLLEEERKRNPPRHPVDIWPNWADGVPTVMRFTGYCERFFKNGVTHRPHYRTETVSLSWYEPHAVTELAKNYGLLPDNITREWAGVYRVFVPGESIDRLLGKDPTGTLYIGMAGAGSRNWSVMRTRVMDFVRRRNHHVADRWSYSDAIRKRFPWDTLWMEWAFTRRRTNYKGEEISGAPMAEGYLLSCYRDSFGELPPFNEKI